MELPPPIEKAWQKLSAALPPEEALDSLTPSEPRGPDIQHAATEAARGLSAPLQAAIYLYVDDLDRAHTIAQAFENRESAYWHGIMHRREGDYPNAKYWFRRAGSLPSEIGQDPVKLTDGISALGRRDDPSDLIQRQRVEWMALFEYCAKGV